MNDPARTGRSLNPVPSTYHALSASADAAGYFFFFFGTAGGHSFAAMATMSLGAP
jgi:hypothetical protein